jgi:hypothetical protein
MNTFTKTAALVALATPLLMTNPAMAGDNIGDPSINWLTPEELLVQEATAAIYRVAVNYQFKKCVAKYKKSGQTHLIRRCHRYR